MKCTLAFSRTTRGHRSWYLSGIRLVHRSGGSTTWSSTEMIRGTSISGPSTSGRSETAGQEHATSTLSGPAGTLAGVTARLDGRAAVVVGGDAGIGRDLALGLRDRGAAVAVTSFFSSRPKAEEAFAAAA